MTPNYQFIGIDLGEGLNQHHTVEIQIRYCISADKFNRKHDEIWMVPDVIGFAAMKDFTIRLMLDGTYIFEETRCKLRAYSLDEGFITDSERDADLLEIDVDNDCYIAKKSEQDKNDRAQADSSRFSKAWVCEESDENGEFKKFGYIMIIENDKQKNNNGTRLGQKAN